VTVSLEDLEYAHNIYLLALATTKLQDKTLSEVTAENEVRMVLLFSSSQLAAIKPN
jgi:hypothetical protein